MDICQNIETWAKKQWQQSSNGQTPQWSGQQPWGQSGNQIFGGSQQWGQPSGAQTQPNGQQGIFHKHHGLHLKAANNTTGQQMNGQSAAKVLENNFSTLDNAGGLDGTKADGQFGKQDLQDIVNNPNNFNSSLVQASRYMLQHYGALSQGSDKMHMNNLTNFSANS